MSLVSIAGVARYSHDCPATGRRLHFGIDYQIGPRVDSSGRLRCQVRGAFLAFADDLKTGAPVSVSQAARAAIAAALLRRARGAGGESLAAALVAACRENAAACHPLAGAAG